MTERVRVFVGLGSNLADPAAQIGRAFLELDALPETDLESRSPLYRSKPLHAPGAKEQDQPDFVNAVAAIRTGLAPELLLDHLVEIEARHGRQREEKWGPRTLDLDILVYGNSVIDTERLSVPHPGVPEREFVLYPLADIAPDLDIPGFGSVAHLLARCEARGIERLEDA